MSGELLMDLADCGSPEKLLAVILKHYPGWTAPVPVEEFAIAVNIVDIRELEADEFEGALLTDANKQKGVILYKAGTRRERRRFTIAHELGHFLIPSHKGNQQCTAADLRESRRGNDHQRREAEANRFAAGLLMPKLWFCRDMGRLGDADVTHIKTLAKQYCTSLEATSNRYCQLTDDICATVFAKDGIIRYLRPTSNFPRMAVAAGDHLPEGCASLRAPAFPLRVATPWAELDGSVWLQTERGRRSPTVLEQTMRQSNGFQISLLFIPLEVTGNEEEEAEIAKSWEVGFRRR
jgi:Zn-dependent peptidase ImmA (M78 family)